MVDITVGARDTTITVRNSRYAVRAHVRKSCRGSGRMHRLKEVDRMHQGISKLGVYILLQRFCRGVMDIFLRPGSDKFERSLILVAVEDRSYDILIS